jgi:hypothetical protein
MTTPKHKITIAWGQDFDPEHDQPVTYSYSTGTELSAFIEGIEAAIGWLEYEVIDDD